ncbi:MAG: ABC transporter permease [Acidobacteriaceae bacterium]
MPEGAAPDWKSILREELAALRLEPGREEAVAEELAQDASERYDDLLARGVPREEAERRVREELSGDRLRPELRQVFRPDASQPASGETEQRAWWPGWGRDLRMAVRVLRLNPLFATVAVVSLALGIGANTAIFQLIDAVVLRTLPVPNPQLLANVDLVHRGRVGSTVGLQQELSFAMWQKLRQKQQAFSDVAAWSTETFQLGEASEARPANGMWVSGDFFNVLGMNPVLGRLIGPGDNQTGCGAQAAVLSYGFWQRNFGGRAAALGQKIALDRQLFTIVGVTPASFTGLEVGRSFDVAIPLCAEPVVHPDTPWTRQPTTWWLDALGRLEPGSTLTHATANLEAISPGIFAATLPSNYDAIERRDYLRFTLRALPAGTGVSDLRQEYQQPLWMLLGISGLVLLIACANLANLMLARAGARQREMAVRLSLGASHARLVRQVLVESLLLAFLGAAAGAALAQGLSRGLIAGIGTASDPVFLSLAMDWRVLGFTAAVAVGTCLFFGVAPALRAAGADPGMALRSGGRSMTAGRERFLLRRGLIVTQVALSLLLVTTALLFVETFRNLVRVNPGFDPRQVTVADFDFSAMHLPMDRQRDFRRNLLEQTRATPGVVDAAEAAVAPLSGGGWDEFIDVPDNSVQRMLTNFDPVSAGYFPILRIPLIAGRTFADSDTPQSPPVAIVNETFAKKFLGHGDPVGKAFGIRQDGGAPDKIYRVIGLVHDTKYYDLRETMTPIVYSDADQQPRWDWDCTLLVRSNVPLATLAHSLNRTATAINPAIVTSTRGMWPSILESLGRERLMATLSGFYGALAAVLAMVGLYGILSWMVVRRRSEIGVRMALGATRRGIVALMLREALALLAVGLAAGTVLVLVAGRAVAAMLYGLKATNIEALLMAMTGMAVITLLASWLPAERAATVDPMETLREE